MSKEDRLRAAGIVAIVFLAAFAFCYLAAAWITWNTATVLGADGKAVRADMGGFLTLIATTTGGSVGAVVAFAFGVTLPSDPGGLAGVRRTWREWGNKAIGTLGLWLLPTNVSLQRVVAWLFFLVYLIVVVIVALVVGARSSVTPDLLQNLVLTALGIGVAVIGANFARE